MVGHAPGGCPRWAVYLVAAVCMVTDEDRGDHAVARELCYHGAGGADAADGGRAGAAPLLHRVARQP